MNKNISAIVFGIAIVIASSVLGWFYLERSRTQGSISVTGLGEKNFTSDLVVWEGSFSASNHDLQTAYEILEHKKRIVKEYLVTNKITEEEVVFLAITTQIERKDVYNDYGKYSGNEFVGYSLSQSLQIESNDVQKVEKVSREITELLNKGVQFYSQPPRYYYTKLADLKIDLIAKATQDARVRAERIAENSGGRLGKLKSAKMGVFQITGQNSSEDYSWGGVFNTSSIEKTASITVKLTYKTR